MCVRYIIWVINWAIYVITRPYYLMMTKRVCLVETKEYWAFIFIHWAQEGIQSTLSLHCMYCQHCSCEDNTTCTASVACVASTSCTTSTACEASTASVANTACPTSIACSASNEYTASAWAITAVTAGAGQARYIAYLGWLAQLQQQIMFSCLFVSHIVNLLLNLIIVNVS